MDNTFNFTHVDPRNFIWDEDHKYVATTGKRHSFSDRYSIMVTPERCDGAPMNLGCRILVKDGDNIEADLHLDILGMQIVAEAIQGIMIEQIAARYAEEEV